MKKKTDYHDFPNVEKQRNFLTSEEFPEGAYGAPFGADEAVENKSTPWEEGQQFTSGYTYEYRNLHQDLPRQDPSAHPTHDEKSKNEEDPYRT